MASIGIGIGIGLESKPSFGIGIGIALGPQPSIGIGIGIDLSEILVLVLRYENRYCRSLVCTSTPSTWLNLLLIAMFLFGLVSSFHFRPFRFPV